jgi:ferric-dicitrate binding protein FerR (iron transport regulator)
MTDRDRPDEATREENEALAAWTVPEPPAGFAERVLAARESLPPAEPEPVVIAIGAAPRRPGSRRRLMPWAVVGAAAVAALVLAQLRSGPPAATSGAAAPSARKSIEIGRRGVAVAEAGAVLGWSIDGAHARVVQRAGDVFYRVERGGRFEVETAHGTVRVTGTCFRVELNPMKKTPWQGLAGAAIGAVLVVTVYEGSVLFAGSEGEREVAAGQVLSASADGSLIADGPGPVRKVKGEEVAAIPPPEASASRDDLLRRDAVQRTEIASLRARVRALESGDRMIARGGDGKEARGPDGRPWFDPGPEELARFAAECRVRNDFAPQLLNSEPFDLPASRAQQAGVSEAERAAINRVMTELQREFQAQLRALYVEVTGDAARAEELSPQSMSSELRDKSPEGEASRINQRIAQERAGLAAPPADPSQLSALERFMRLQAGLGAETERRVGQVLGAERAHAMRSEDGGWGWRQETVGCPDEDQPRP